MKRFNKEKTGKSGNVVLSETIDKKTGDQWIRDRAKELCVEQMTLDKLCKDNIRPWLEYGHGCGPSAVRSLRGHGMKKRGHYCKVCGEYKANEKFSGKGHAAHICKTCAALPPEKQAEEMALTRLVNLPWRL